LPVSAESHATAVPDPSIGGPSGTPDVAGGTVGDTAAGLSAGVVDGPVPPVSPDRSLLRTAAPRTATTTNVAATSPRRAPDEVFDSIVNNLSGPGR